MKLFGKKQPTGCCCNGQCSPAPSQPQNTPTQKAGIKILGSGCAKCNQLEENTKQALSQLNLTESIDHVTDFSQIAAYGVMSTPALVVDEKVVAFGKVLRPEEIKTLIARERGING